MRGSGREYVLILLDFNLACSQTKEHCKYSDHLEYCAFRMSTIFSTFTSVCVYFICFVPLYIFLFYKNVWYYSIKKPIISLTIYFERQSTGSPVSVLLLLHQIVNEIKIQVFYTSWLSKVIIQNGTSLLKMSELTPCWVTACI